MDLQTLAWALLGGATTALGLSVAVAQTAVPAPARPLFAAPPYTNLKVFPADISRENLLWNMRFFSQSLGVRCTHCHVGEEGQPLATFDFASDAKDQKLKARDMLRMVHRINREDFGVQQFKDVKVTCFTCHRGSTKPVTEPPPAQPAPTPPADRG